jgi:hypothetical protein
LRIHAAAEQASQELHLDSSEIESTVARITDKAAPRTGRDDPVTLSKGKQRQEALLVTYPGFRIGPDTLDPKERAVASEPR